MRKDVVPKSMWKHYFGLGLRTFIVFELAGAIGGYFVWKKMEKDQRFRLQVYQLSPSSLGLYYNVVESLDKMSNLNTCTRDHDEKTWRMQGVIKDD